MRLRDKSKFTFDFPVPNTEPVIFYADDMELGNPVLDGYSCEFSKIFGQWERYYN